MYSLKLARLQVIDLAAALMLGRSKNHPTLSLYILRTPPPKFQGISMRKKKHFLLIILHTKTNS